jgi:hypothetical protein
MDVMYIFANDESTGNFSLLNWINPSIYTIIKINTPIFFSNAGWGGGANILLSSSWSPSIGNNFQQDNASFGGMVFNTPDATGGALIGTNGGTHSNIFLAPRTVNSYRTSLNNATRQAFNIPQNFMAKKVLGAFRSSSTAYDQFYPSSSTVNAINIQAVVSTTPTTQQLNILSANSLGTRLYGANNTASMFWAGGYEIRNRLTTFTSSMTTYIDSI